MPKRPEQPAGTEPQRQEPTADAAPADGAEDMRQRYREALERKQHKAASQSGAGADAGGKSLAATSNSKTQRVFRRKSGG